MVKDFPFTGAGMGTFERVVPLLYPFHTSGEASAIPHAHNQLLHVAAELGIPGLFAYLALSLNRPDGVTAVNTRRLPSGQFLSKAGDSAGFFVWRCP